MKVGDLLACILVILLARNSIIIACYRKHLRKDICWVLELTTGKSRSWRATQLGFHMATLLYPWTFHLARGRSFLDRSESYAQVTERAACLGLEKALIGSLIAVISGKGEAFIFEVQGLSWSSHRGHAVAN